MASEFEIGYGKPPKHGQFKKGHSGNPNGRPKGAKNLKTELKEELQEKIVLKEGGQAKIVSKQRAMLKSLTAKAVQGDTKAANLLLNLVFKMLHQDDTQAEAVDWTKTDETILKAFAADILKNAKHVEKADD